MPWLVDMGAFMTIRRVLVIKLGALGDFIQAMGPFAAIRAHHPAAHITLLTTRPFVAMAEACPWFDAVWVDDKPSLWQPAKLMDLRRNLRAGRFDRVYDLQTSDRSSSYFRLMGKAPQWSGIAPGCSHPHANAHRDLMHTIERQREQLAMAGIKEVPPPDLSWVKSDLERFALPQPFVLLCPGGAAHRPGKRWPGERFAALAVWLAGGGSARSCWEPTRRRPSLPPSRRPARTPSIWRGGHRRWTSSPWPVPPWRRWATIPAPCI